MCEVNYLTSAGRRLYQCSAQPGTVQFNLEPERGNDCKVFKLFVQEGKEVKQFDKICEIQSSDNSVEVITSPYHGLVTKLYRKEGEDACAGSSLMEICPYDPCDVEPNLEIYNGAYNPLYQKA
jgi:hypothetical protein